MFLNTTLSTLVLFYFRTVTFCVEPTPLNLSRNYTEEINPFKVVLLSRQKTVKTFEICDSIFILVVFFGLLDLRNIVISGMLVKSHVTK